MGELGQGRKRPNISNDSALKGNATTEAKIIIYLNDSDKERDKGKTRLYVSLSFCLYILEIFHNIDPSITKE